MKKTLKPCPLCGNKNIKIEIRKIPDGYCSYEDYFIVCDKCGIELRKAADNYYGRNYYTENQVIDLWNRRK